MKPVSELSGLDLRRAYCELRGWKKEASGLWTGLDGRKSWYSESRLPPFESNATLSEGELERVCAENGWTWEVSRVQGSANVVCEISDVLVGDIGIAIASQHGSTPSETRVRALVSALRSKK